MRIPLVAKIGILTRIQGLWKGLISHMWLESRDLKFFPKQGQQVLDSSWWIQSTGSQRVRHNWATELNWTETAIYATWKQNTTKQKLRTALLQKNPNTLIHIDKIWKIEHWLRRRLPWIRLPDLKTSTTNTYYTHDSETCI